LGFNLDCSIQESAKYFPRKSAWKVSQKCNETARQAAETISCAIVFRTVGFYTDFHNVIAAALDQLSVAGDRENGSAVPRFAFQPFCDQAQILPTGYPSSVPRDPRRGRETSSPS